MADYVEEAQSHYDRTIGLLDGKVIHIERCIYNAKTTGIRQSHLRKIMEYEEAKTLIEIAYRHKGQMQSQHALLSDVDFQFPDSKLINSIDKKRPKAVFINRYSYRQWRRGLRLGMLQKFVPNQWLLKQLGLRYSLGEKLTWQEVEEFFYPTYYSVDEVCEQAKQLPGTYAISPEFWVGVGRPGLVFGYHQYTIGHITDEGIFELDERGQDLYELLVETVGGERASIRGNWL